MAGNGQKTRQREKAICGLLQQPTITQAAVYAGVSEGTLYRWLRKDAAFQAAYAEARRECVRQATARLQRACSGAVEHSRYRYGKRRFPGQFPRDGS